MGDNLISKTWGEGTSCSQLVPLLTLRGAGLRWLENWGRGARCDQTGGKGQPGKTWKTRRVGAHGNKESRRVGFSSIK